MKKLFVLLLVLFLCSTANASWVKPNGNGSVTRTRVTTDLTIPTTATTTSVNTSDFNTVLIEASSNCMVILRPYAWSDTFNRYMPIASSPAASTVGATTLVATKGNILIATGASLVVIPSTYGYSNVFVAVVKKYGEVAGRWVSYKVIPTQLMDYQR